MPSPTLDDLRAALTAHGVKLRRVGSEEVGPCWRCGGDNRFHIRQGDTKPIIGCRICGDDPRAYWRDTCKVLLDDTAPSATSSGVVWRTREWTCVEPDTDATATHFREDYWPTKKRVWWSTGARSKRLIYRARLTGTGPLIVCEGEPAADAVAAHGLDAIGIVCGAPTAPEASALVDCGARDVILWPDNDDQGRLQMARVAELLKG